MEAVYIEGGAALAPLIMPVECVATEMPGISVDGVADDDATGGRDSHIILQHFLFFFLCFFLSYLEFRMMKDARRRHRPIGALKRQGRQKNKKKEERD